MILPQKENQLNSDKHISTSIVLHESVVYKDHPNPGNQYLPVTTSIESINIPKQKKVYYVHEQGFGRRNGPCA